MFPLILLSAFVVGSTKLNEARVSTDSTQVCGQVALEYDTFFRYKITSYATPHYCIV